MKASPAGQTNYFEALTPLAGVVRALTIDVSAPVGRAAGVPAAAIEIAQKGRLLLAMEEPTTAWRDLPSGQLEGSASAVAMLLAERGVHGV